MIYNILLVSGIQQSDSDIYIYIKFWIGFLSCRTSFILFIKQWKLASCFYFCNPIRGVRKHHLAISSVSSMPLATPSNPSLACIAAESLLLSNSHVPNLCPHFGQISSRHLSLSDDRLPPVTLWDGKCHFLWSWPVQPVMVCIKTKPLGYFPGYRNNLKCTIAKELYFLQIVWRIESLTCRTYGQWRTLH